MRVLGKEHVQIFCKKHASTRKAFSRWIRLLEDLDANSPKNIKDIFGGNVDFVGKQAVFDIGGNKVRAITKIEYGIQIILITHVLTHSEYDKNKWKENQ